MIRFLVSLMVGALLGIGLGIGYGWGIDPVEYVNSPMSNLAPRHQDDYTVMVAAGFAVDNDVDAALERLRPLGVDNVPAYVQDITERYITNARDIEDIRLLVSLAEGLGRLTPPMERFRQLNPDGGSQ
jgi:hypothetical protein